MFSWRKLGRVFDPRDVEIDWMKDFAQAPSTLVLDDRVRVYFACRPGADSNGQFVSYVAYVDFKRDNLLERVNRFAEEQLGHRFERTGPESSEFVEVVRRNTQVLVETTDKLVQRQAHLWGQSMEEARTRWHDTGRQQHVAGQVVLIRDLEGKDQAGRRGFEDGGHACRGAGHQQHLGVAAGEVATEPTLHRRSDGRPEVDRGALVAHGPAQPQGGDAGQDPTGFGGQSLDLLVAGDVPPNPGELIESAAMEALLERAKSTYDLVVIDTTPLTVVSDAYPLLRKVDGVSSGPPATEMPRSV